MQTDPDFEHIMLIDEEGRGVHWANSQIADLAGKLQGDYIYILDDDDFIICETFIEELKRKIDSLMPILEPEVFVVKGWIHEKEYPRNWHAQPERGKIAAPNFIVRRDIFDKHCEFWNIEKRGDFNFINAVWQYNWTFEWWDRFIFYASPSAGKTEQQKNVIREKVYY
jgi:hypothetical protein